MIAGQLALTIAALFTGAAFYINWAEQPARLALDDRALLQQWKPSYKAGFQMQATLAVLGFLAGATAWYLTGTTLDKAGPASRTLIEKWGGLHGIRTALGAAATTMFLVASL